MAPSRRTLLQAAGLAPMVLPAHHRSGHGGVKESPTPTPSPTDPGPAGDLSFSGYNWLRRTWPGAPHYNGQWSGDNVVLNGDGTVTLRLTNPGGSPVAAELLSTRTGWGYGSYSLDFRADFDVVSQSVVWGNLFTYDSTQPWDASHNEIDAGEISAWGVPGIAPRLTAGYWLPGPTNVLSHNESLPTGPRVFRTTMTWGPGTVSFATYAGATAADTLIASSRVDSSTLPVPAAERVHVNLWVTSANEDDETATAPFEVTVTGFGFAPA
ncbi:hypothetical protein [uncultured Serinicoccus sp.]|uniref:hypothetical protein n=1 Tax=uncultured Serinicoccus sp. TaxID=735514 RepID=UPI00262EE182|nr:hypothetical protein [uncultured Serinicoccus sp.]